MRESLTVGATAEITIVVDATMRPAFDGVVVHEVYSTWSLAHHLEIAARHVLVPHLEPHEEGIGAHLSIDHLAPTPVGGTVRIVATAIEVEATTLVCELRAYHEHSSGSRAIATGRQVQRILPRTTLNSLIERAKA